MKHLQTRMNADGTLCMDYYNEELYTADTAEEIKKCADYLEQQTGKKIRRFPFSITCCASCGHPIVTNRDYLDEISCKNCGEMFPFLPQWNEINQAILKRINGAMGYSLENCNGYRVFMLSFIPAQTDASELGEIMKLFGFQAAHCEGEIYELLLKAGAARKWTSPGCTVGFSKTVLDERDCIFDDKIPRVEACARFITNYYSNQIKTASIHIRAGIEDDASASKAQMEIKKQIEQLTAEGRIEEALKLLEQV